MALSIIIDIITVAILALTTFFSIKKGFASCLLNLISFILAIVLAFALFNPVADYIINNTELDDGLEKTIADMLGKKETNEDGTIKNTDESLPDGVVEYINKQIKDTVDGAKDSAVTKISKDMSVTIIKACSWIGIFIIATILLIVIKLVFKLVTKIPGLHQLDKAGGAIWGIIEGLLIIWVILAIISVLGPSIENTGIVKAINKSFITNFLNEYNLLLKFIF